jgi:hypothetical protein
MKFQNVKETAELVGVGAIVASLIFVGLQMRQTAAIARGQMYSNQLANALASYSAISDHPDIWVRGKRGDELDPADAEVFYQQVLGVADQAYYEVKEGDLLGFGTPERVLDIADFAGFLYENPGARRVWKDEEQRLRKVRRLVMPGEQRSTWADQVNEMLLKIEKSDSSTRPRQ